VREEPYDDTTQPGLHPLAALCTWLVPGLGHWMLGYRRRGRLIAAGILGMYLTGLLVGGLSVINREDSFWWYCGQTLVGPATPVINWWRQSHPPPDDPDDHPGYVYAVRSYAKVNEVGTLYTTLAGLMNLMAILDVLYKAPCGARARRRRTEDREP